MDNLLCIKGRIVGEGTPLVCVPIMESSKDRIIEEARRLVQLGADMIEWRVDAFEQVHSINAIREVLAELKPIVCETILVYTFRSKNQGGLLALSPEEICDIHQVASETDAVDLVDLEYFETRKPEKEIRQLQEKGVHVIASHHDFEQTPERNVIRMLLEQMKDSGADIVKLAVMPKSMSDVIKLMEETNSFHEEYPDKALITMSMGAKGAVSRVSGEFFGSCVTFGSGEQASAPGQLPMEELTQVLSILHKSLNRC